MILNLRTFRRTLDIEPVSSKMSHYELSNRNRGLETRDMPEDDGTPLGDQVVETLRRDASWEGNSIRREQDEVNLVSTVRYSPKNSSGIHYLKTRRLFRPIRGCPMNHPDDSHSSSSVQHLHTVHSMYGQAILQIVKPAYSMFPRVTAEYTRT